MVILNPRFYGVVVELLKIANRYFDGVDHYSH